LKLLKKSKQLEKEFVKILEQDPTTFQYDEVYDDVKKPKKEIEKPQKNKPKYIQSLIEHHKKREQTKKLVTGSNMDKYSEKFITAAYKEILQKRNQQEQEEAKCDAKDVADDVTKKKDIYDFYLNLHKNIAMGGDTEKTPEPEQKHTKILFATPQPPMDTKSISSDHHSPVTNISSRHKGSRSPHCHRDRSRSPDFRSHSSNQRHYHPHRSDSHSSRDNLRYSLHSNQSNRKRVRSKSPVLLTLEELTLKNQGKDEETKRTELVKKLKLDKQTDECAVNAARQRYLERLKNKATESV